MSLLLWGLALTAPFVFYLLVKDPGSGRGCVIFAGGMVLTYAAGMGWLPPAAGLVGIGVGAIGLAGAVDGWWD